MRLGCALQQLARKVSAAQNADALRDDRAQLEKGRSGHLIEEEEKEKEEKKEQGQTMAESAAKDASRSKCMWGGLVEVV